MSDRQTREMLATGEAFVTTVEDVRRVRDNYAAPLQQRIRELEAQLERQAAAIQAAEKALKVQRDALYTIRDKQHGNVSAIDLNHGISLLDAALVKLREA